MTINRGYEEMDAAFQRMEAGELDGVVPALERALAFAPDSDEVKFRFGAMLMMTGDPRGRSLLDELFAKNPGWRDLIPRLVAKGLIPDMPGVTELLTGE